MKKLLPAVLLLCLISTVFAAYPREYPLYLGLMGFKKSEIEGLRDGGSVTHSIPDKLPGEYGISAARVFNVPVYYFRDYYRQIENFRSLFHFDEVGKFKPKPDLHDLKPLRFTDGELNEFLTCRAQDCGLKLSSEEIAGVPANPDMKTDVGKEAVSDAYRMILLNRLLAYQAEGMKGLGKYEDSATVQSPQEIFNMHMQKFQHLEAYFPGVTQYVRDYPDVKDKRSESFFYWVREHQGSKPIISIRRVVTRRVGEDFIVINHVVYSNHYFLSSIAVMHLIHYSDAVTPWTLFAYQQRTLTDLNGPFKAFGRNILRTNTARSLSNDFREIGKEMELRYKSRSFANFPFGLYPRDQR